MPGGHELNAMSNESNRRRKLVDEGSCCEPCSSSKRCKRPPTATNNGDGIETISQTLSGIIIGDAIMGSSGTLSVSSCASNKVQGQLIGFKRNFGSVNGSKELVHSASNTSPVCTQDQVTAIGSSYNLKRPRFHICQLSPGAGAREEYTSFCDETSLYSTSAERSQRRGCDEVRGVRVNHDSNGRRDRRGLSLEFEDLPPDIVETLLMRLPVVSLYSSRLVNRQWNAMISSIISCSQRRELWANNKPDERWLLLYNKMQEVLFYDVQRNVCYHWHKKFWPFIADSQTYCFPKVTSLNGTVFVSICRPDIHELTRIWECNPLTDGHDQLPLMPHSSVSVLDMVAVRRHDRTVPGSYKLLVFSTDYQYPGVTRLQVYDPVTKAWEEVANLMVAEIWLPEVVKSFGTSDGKIVVFDKFQTNLNDPKWKFHYYSVHGNEWITHQIQGFQSGRRFVQQWEVFEKDWELILLLVDRDPVCTSRSARAQIWRTALPLLVDDQQPPRVSPWQLLSTMPPVLKVLEVSGDGVASTGANQSHASRILDDPDLKVFAVGDEINGDRLIIISSRSKSAVAFNFTAAPYDAWVAIPFSTLVSRSRPNSSTYFPKSAEGSDAGSSNRTANMRGTIRRLLADRSMMGVTFQPDVRLRLLSS